MKCNCCTLQRFYGPRAFKCRFTHCSFRRHGFETDHIRKSHEKYHDRPWRCSVPTCEYAGGGFLSRKMRDDHLDSYHQQQKSKEALPLSHTDPDEIQPLLFDLIAADDVEAVKELLPSFKKLDDDVQEELQRLAASLKTLAMLKLLCPYWPPSSQEICFALIKNRHYSFIESVLATPKSSSRFRRDYIIPVLETDSPEIFELFRKHTVAAFEIVPAPYILLHEYFDRKMFTACAGIPQREEYVARIWEASQISMWFEPSELGRALVILVRSSCYSCRLGESLIQAGANVNYRRSEIYMTPLHHAVRKSSLKAAEFIRFLLLHGADPEMNPSFEVRSTKIREEKGAREISRWLGVSWDELVEQTKEYRQKE